MQVNGQVDAIKAVMGSESPSHKIMFAILAGIWTIFFAVCGGIYLSYMSNAISVDDAICGDSKTTVMADLCNQYNGKAYDNFWLAGDFSESDIDKIDSLR